MALLKTLKFTLLSLGERDLKSQVQAWDSNAIAEGAAGGGGTASIVGNVISVETMQVLNGSE
jgi:hypothetical protein